MFETANTDAIKTRRPMTILLSTALQAAVTAGAVIVTMVQVDALPKMKLTQPVPIARMDPKPIAQTRTPAARTLTVQPTRTFIYREPSEAALRNTPIVLLDDAPVTGYEGTSLAPTTGVPGGGFSPGLPPTGAVSAPPPPPPGPSRKPETPSAIRVSEGVQGAKLIHRPTPVYPHLARTARISGRVRMDATIARDGTIRNLRVIAGHPLLTQAAIDAVSQWRYSPTLLSGVPVEVLTQIEVNFVLGTP